MTRPSIPFWIIGAGVLAITFSDSVGGLCARCAIAMIGYWTGAISAETATRFALFYQGEA